MPLDSFFIALTVLHLESHFRYLRAAANLNLLTQLVLGKRVGHLAYTRSLSTHIQLVLSTLKSVYPCSLFQTYPILYFFCIGSWGVPEEEEEEEEEPDEDRIK